jgi:putative endonuclease
MKGYLYILQSQKNTAYYVGSSIDPERRLIEHNAGKNRSTSNLRPLIRLFLQEFATIKEARQIEYKLKKQKSRIIIEKIIKDGVIKMGR